MSSVLITISLCLNMYAFIHIRRLWTANTILAKQITQIAEAMMEFSESVDTSLNTHRDRFKTIEKGIEAIFNIVSRQK